MKHQKKYQIFKSIVAIIILLSSTVTFAIQLSWSSPPESDLQGYLIFIGFEARVYSDTIDVGNVLSYEISSIDTGVTYHFAVTAYDNWGNLSEPSPEIQYYIEPLSPIKTYPEIIKANLINATELEIEFDQFLDAEIANKTAYYRIHPFIPISEASISPEGNKVILKTSIHVAGEYQITMNYEDFSSSIEYQCQSTGIKESLSNVRKFSLAQNYPNPFNSKTCIPFTVEESEYTTLTIFNTNGEKVNTLINSNVNPAKNQVTWDGQDESGNQVSSGVYIYRLQQGENIQTRQLILKK